MDKEQHPGYPANPRARKVVRVIEPTRQEWDDYRAAVDALEYLRQSPYYDEGGPEYKSSIGEPQTRTEYEYTETWDEYRERFNREEGRELR